jgi:Ca2+-binding RTX toxin-like protein
MRREGRRVAVGSIALLALTIASIAVLSPAAFAAKPKCFGKKATIVGTKGDDELEGTNGRDVIVGKGGDDVIRAKGGNDLVCAGGGGFGGIFLGGGNDKMKGGKGNDITFPGPGNDLIKGGGGEGFDWVTYEGSETPIVANLQEGTLGPSGGSRRGTGSGGSGTDTFDGIEALGGSEGNDILIGDDRGNSIFGNAGDDDLQGFGGDDFLSVGKGDDTASGGDGSDLLDLLTSEGGPGFDDDIFSTGGATADLSTGTVTGGADVGSDTFTSMEEIGGTLGDDTLTGEGSNNRIVAFSGNDTIEGAGGDDFIEPGPGDDSVDGGDGADSVDYFEAFPEPFGSQGPVTIDLAAGTATGPGLGSDTLTEVEGGGGTILDDTIIGTDGPNPYLLGDEGNDTITGAGGDDYLDGDAFFFGIPEELPGTDDLDGGDGTDTCLGGNPSTNCEVTEPPAGRKSALAHYRASRADAALRYGR